MQQHLKQKEIKSGATILSTCLKGSCANAATSSIYALNRRKDASAAEPMANPFVVAFVVFPTASRRSVISLTLSGCENNGLILDKGK